MTLSELEQTVSELPPDELASFREWFLEFSAKRFDEAIERDCNSGALDRLAEEAIGEHLSNESKRL